MRITYKGKSYQVSVVRGCVYIEGNPVEHYPREMRDLAYREVEKCRSAR